MTPVKGDEPHVDTFTHSEGPDTVEGICQGRVGRGRSCSNLQWSIGLRLFLCFPDGTDVVIQGTNRMRKLVLVVSGKEPYTKNESTLTGIYYVVRG